MLTKFIVWSFVLDGVAIGLSLFSAIVEYRASKRLTSAINDLHESHKELHELIQRLP